MNLVPCGHRVIVEMRDITDFDPVYVNARKAGIELAEHHEDHQRKQAAVDKAYVVAVGPTAFADFGGAPWCKVGDLVVFAKYAGKQMADGDKKYILLNDEDVCAVIKKQ